MQDIMIRIQTDDFEAWMRIMMSCMVVLPLWAGVRSAAA